MTDVKDLVLTIVRPLVSYPEAIELEIEESDDFLEYNLTVHPDDVGRVIGKQGRVAKAIRTIVYSVRLDGAKRVRLNIVD
ncbi:KH domain-containing protein [Vagococcus lutrae]|uniref:RNA-binding protein KhpA n=2 Tax=Vagococcus lutrae TaxID=81947 RepID=V6Q711_9ENTE|nr:MULTISPECIES: KH domain-containing protein [Vagococcus]EST90455.1 KH domain-containing protein [Vagococcus lutrae LBD1]MCO7151407.1 KH domain-containing protein [Vagococcus lutrae]MDT2800806.1 KH domain-containing protein [Vagococcus lutrae]MDT2805324.1 KH domain-containing protein [Vagococcus lutrae]MDT2807106.1 KH domain-containing protein [Vagococcus lutrae]